MRLPASSKAYDAEQTLSSPTRRQEHGQDTKGSTFCQAAELQQSVFQYQGCKIEALCPLQMFLRALQWLKQAIKQELEM